MEAIDDGAQRARVSTVVVGGGSGREFLGLNRARHAVLEASILASRARLLGDGEIRAELAPAAGARRQDGRAARARGDGVRHALVRAVVGAPVTAVRVEAPARLHLGMLAVAGDGARRFGGLGVAVDRPAVVIEARPAGELSRRGRRRRARADVRAALPRGAGARGRRARARGRGDPAARRARLGHEAGARRGPGAGDAARADRRRAGAGPGRRGARARSAVGTWTFALGRPRRRGRRPARPRAPGAAAGAPPDARASGASCSSSRRPSRGCPGPPRRRRSRQLVPSAERSAAIAQLVLTSLLPALVEATSRSSAPR